MTGPEDVQAELASLRRQLADANAAVGAQKRQLAEAKAKAKGIIQRKMVEADAKVEACEEQNKLQSDELAKLKQILREADQERARVSGECDSLRRELDETKSHKEELATECQSLQCELADVKIEGEKAAEEAKVRNESVQEELRTLREELAELRETHEASLKAEADPPPSPPDETVVSALREQLLRAEHAMSELEHTCEELRTENVSLKATTKSQSETNNVDSPETLAEVAESREELRQTKECVEALAKDLERTREEASAKLLEHGETVRELDSERAKVLERLSAAEAQVSQLQGDLARSETVLQEEREKTIQAQKASESSDSGDDEKIKILEAKLSEMERVVATKQAEIGNVKDKAKTYLREMNAKKQAAEAQMKAQTEALQKKLEEEQDKLDVAEQRAEKSSSELDNCLALIREKQKSVQMLKMAVSTQKTAADKAVRDTDSLRAEFARYKERARMALQEKEASTESTEAVVEAATSALGAQLQATQQEAAALKQEVRRVRDLERKYVEALARAEKAEAAVDLLRKDGTNVPTTNYSQIDGLQEELANLEGELATARSGIEDAEARHDTTKMRLEAAERALRGAEMRAEERDRLSTKTIASLRKQVNSLESELNRAQVSAAAAQRTAAAAAKALAIAAPGVGETQSGRSTSVESPSEGNGIPYEDASPFANSSPRSGGRTSLAAVIEGHADGLGLRASFDSHESVSPMTDSERKMKDKQVAVLTSQVAELGALLDDVQQEAQLKSEQTALLKEEVKNLDAKLAAAEKLQNGAPFSYLRTIVVRYLETDDSTLLPVIANVLSFTEEENTRIKACRGSKAVSTATQKSGYFGMPFLGSR